jgi:hypothetical protein
MFKIHMSSEIERVSEVKRLMESVGTRIGSVHFVKRGDGKKRKISYRLHVKSPSYAKKPTGKKSLEKKVRDINNQLITIFDTNMIRYNKKGLMSGRGGYKSIPLDGVYRLKVNGEIYRIIF